MICDLTAKIATRKSLFQEGGNMSDKNCEDCLYQPEAPGMCIKQGCLKAGLIKDLSGFKPKPTFEPETCGNCAHRDMDKILGDGRHFCPVINGYVGSNNLSGTSPSCSWTPKKCERCGDYGEIMESEDELAESIPCRDCSLDAMASDPDIQRELGETVRSPTSQEIDKCLSAKDKPGEIMIPVMWVELTPGIFNFRTRGKASFIMATLSRKNNRWTWEETEITYREGLSIKEVKLTVEKALGGKG